MSIAVKRLTKELTILKKEADTLEGIIIDDPTDIMTWSARIKGPPDTPYEEGTFEMLIKFDLDYPKCAPSVKFLTPMYHPNIYRDGKICIDILQSNEWIPSQNVRTILTSIRSLLMDPNPSSPANREAAELYNTDIKAYENKVREFVNVNKK
jgi:ubiquitin-conjugating enzyme E2 A